MMLLAAGAMILESFAAFIVSCVFARPSHGRLIPTVLWSRDIPGRRAFSSALRFPLTALISRRPSQSHWSKRPRPCESATGRSVCWV